MNDKLMKKLDKKGKKLNPIEKKAKMDVVKSLSEQAGSMLGDKIKGMKKVTVAAPDKEGLEKGLETAEKIIGSEEQSDESMETSEPMESSESDEKEDKMDELMEYAEECSPEELEEKIKKLQEIKQSKLNKEEY